VRLFLPLGLVLPLLAGCSLSPTAPLSSAPPTPEAGVAITGVVHGGQAAIVGQHIYLFAANTTGSGGNGIAASTSNASISLLNGTSVAANNGVQNVGWGEDASNNYYVITDANGNFALTGDYTCTTGQQVYVYGVGGNTGSGANSAAGLLAVLGACPGSTFSSGLFVNMNEVSTIAAAYAMAGWATDATHVSTDSGVSPYSSPEGLVIAATAAAGMANAFANAASLETLNTGVALATTTSGGTVPQTTINTLANILAACVNTSGPGSSGCNTLLTNATSNGVPVGTSGTGIEATDTATAALYIAQNPGANVTALYGLSTPSPPFGTALTAQPNDFTIGINYTGGGLNTPYGIAIDASGNAWVTSYHAGLTEFSSTGSVLLALGSGTGGLDGPAGIAIASSYGGGGGIWVGNNVGNSVMEFNSSGTPVLYITGDGLNAPSGIALDGVGNVWIANYGNSSFTVLRPGGDLMYSSGSAYAGFSLDSPQGIAIDGYGSGDAWIANTGGSSQVSQFAAYMSPLYGGELTDEDSFGEPLAGYGNNSLYPAAFDAPQGVAVDGAGNVWVASSGGASINEIVNNYTYNQPFDENRIGNYTGGGLNGPAYIAIDGAGNAWVSNHGGTSVSEFSGAGATLSPDFEYSSASVAISGSNGFTGGSINAPYGIAIDSSGNVWIANGGNSTITELIGAAAPVITPLGDGLYEFYITPTAGGPNYNGSSYLGMRP